MIKVGILGAAGYTGGELIRVLLNHPEAEIVFANSESNAGNLVSDVHEELQRSDFCLPKAKMCRKQPKTTKRRKKQGLAP